jgi:hypothetical protein
MERNYVAEMRALIDEETSHGPYVSATIAQNIVDKLRANDPELLDGWLHIQAATLIRQAINLRDSSQRTHARITASRSVFAQAAIEAEAGNPEPLTKFLDTVYVVDDGSRVRLRDMRAAQLNFAADSYRRRAQDAMMQQAFLRVLARKIGTGTVEDHFDEVRLAKLWRDIGK